MTELSNMVDLERFTGLTTIEIAAAMTDLHMSTCREQIWQCEMCADFLRVIRQVVAAVRPLVEEDHLVDLAAAGRLLPEGAEHDVKVILRWYDGAGRLLDDWGTADVGTARRLGQRTHPSKAVRGEIRSKESWAAPWSVVEPVAVEEAAE